MTEILDEVTAVVIDRFCKYRCAYSDVPGFQVSIRRKDALIFSKAYGLANVKTGAAYTPKHFGHIASHSKMFTSCLLFAMQAAGLLAVDDLLITHLPQFKKHRDKRVREITLRDLVTNRAGIFRDGLDCEFWELGRPFLSRAALQDEFIQTGLVYDPNTKTKYSNIGFSLLGLALEAASGAPYDVLIDRFVTGKIKGFQAQPDYAPGRFEYADGHSKVVYDGKRRVYKHAAANGMAPATGFCGTTDQTTRFLHEIYFTDTIVPKRIARDFLALNWPVAHLDNAAYGLGMQFSMFDKRVFVGHSGGYPGFTSQTRHVIGSDYIYSFILNANEAFTLSAIRSMAEITARLRDHFTDAELKTVTVSAPMMNKWGSSLYVVGRKTVLELPLESWLVNDGINVLTAQKNGTYRADMLDGYGNLGEPIRFNWAKGTITSINDGASTLYPERVFMKRGSRTFL